MSNRSFDYTAAATEHKAGLRRSSSSLLNWRRFWELKVFWWECGYNSSRAHEVWLYNNGQLNIRNTNYYHNCWTLTVWNRFKGLESLCSVFHSCVRRAGRRQDRLKLSVGVLLIYLKQKLWPSKQKMCTRVVKQRFLQRTHLCILDCNSCSKSPLLSFLWVKTSFHMVYLVYWKWFAAHEQEDTGDEEAQNWKLRQVLGVV